MPKKKGNAKKASFIASDLKGAGGAGHGGYNPFDSFASTLENPLLVPSSKRPLYHLRFSCTMRTCFVRLPASPNAAAQWGHAWSLHFSCTVRTCTVRPHSVLKEVLHCWHGKPQSSRLPFSALVPRFFRSFTIFALIELPAHTDSKRREMTYGRRSQPLYFDAWWRPQPARTSSL